MPWAVKMSLNLSVSVCVQGCSYSCVVTTPDSKSLYAVGTDKKLKELEEVAGTGTQITKELDTGVMVNSIALPAGLYFFLNLRPSCVSVCGTLSRRQQRV